MERRGFVLGTVASALMGCANSPNEAPSVVPGAIVVGGCDFSVVFEGEPPNLPRSAYGGWVRTSAQMITDYYGGTFPVPGLEVTAGPQRPC